MVKEMDQRNKMTSSDSDDSHGNNPEGAAPPPIRPVIDTWDMPKETRPGRLFREKSSTFPQSGREIKKKNMPKSSKSHTGPKARSNPTFDPKSNIYDEPALSRALLGMPEDAQQVGSSQNDSPYEIHPFDKQLKALLTAYQKEPGRKEAVQNSKRFIEIWEAQLLPKIEQILDGVVGDYTINVSRDTEPGKRTIVIVTDNPMTNDVEKQLRESKSEMLPSDLDACTSIMLRQGGVKYLNDPGTPPIRVSSMDSDDSCTSALNIDWSPEPTIGDSVGWKNHSATLGPLLQIDRRFYRLLTWHLFEDEGPNKRCDDARPPKGLSTTHPSATDRKRLNEKVTKDANGECPHLVIGDVTEYSGLMCNTTRTSVTIGQDQGGGGVSGSVEVVTDWALVDAAEANYPYHIPRPNVVRQGVPRGVSWDTRQQQPNGGATTTTEIEITKSESPADFIQRCDADTRRRLVYSVGRTSGYTIGELNEACGSCKLRGRRTREWAVERAQLPRGYNDYTYNNNIDGNETETENNKTAIAQWIRAGMGVEGDSGAGVFSLEGNTLLGQVWGRNAYKRQDETPRIVFFTAMADIYADIRERITVPSPSSSGSTFVQLPTRASITHAFRDAAPHNNGENSAILASIPEGLVCAEELDDGDLMDDEEEPLRELEVWRRSAAKAKVKAKVKSSRLGPVGAARVLAKQAGFHQQASHGWVRVIIHAATF